MGIYYYLILDSNFEIFQVSSSQERALVNALNYMSMLPLTSAAKSAHTNKPLLNKRLTA
jgi:hypothetical protein